MMRITFGAEGAKYLAEAIKLDSTLQKMFNKRIGTFRQWSVFILKSNKQSQCFAMGSE
jgi:hypothetical protein